MKKTKTKTSKRENATKEDIYRLETLIIFSIKALGFEITWDEKGVPLIKKHNS